MASPGGRRPPGPPAPRPRRTPGDGPGPASLARRSAGAFVNATAYLLLLVGVLLLVVVVDGVSAGDGTSGAPAIVALTLAPLVLPAVFLPLAGGTPGMLLFGMRVVDGDGGRPGWGPSAVRSAVVWGPYLALAGAPAVLGAGSTASTVAAWLATAWFVALAWSIRRDPAGRGWQDRMAGVRVVAVASGPTGTGR